MTTQLPHIFVLTLLAKIVHILSKVKGEYLLFLSFSKNFEICSFLNEKIIFFREWTCDNCMRDVVLISTQYSLPEITHGLEYWLMHEAYCEDPALGLNENQIEHCQDGIKGFLGPAFRALDAAYVAQAQSICHYWYDGVCPRPHY